MGWKPKFRSDSESLGSQCSVYPFHALIFRYLLWKSYLTNFSLDFFIFVISVNCSGGLLWFLFAPKQSWDISPSPFLQEWEMVMHDFETIAAARCLENSLLYGLSFPFRNSASLSWIKAVQNERYSCNSYCRRWIVFWIRVFITAGIDNFELLLEFDIVVTQWGDVITCRSIVDFRLMNDTDLTVSRTHKNNIPPWLLKGNKFET